MYPDHLALSDRLKAAHGQSWQAIAKAGDFFTGLGEEKINLHPGTLQRLTLLTILTHLPMSQL